VLALLFDPDSLFSRIENPLHKERNDNHKATSRHNTNTMLDWMRCSVLKAGTEPDIHGGCPTLR
jgi:hypothetical protein